MRENSKGHWILGICGCICFGIGDWLLGYVDPGVIGGEFGVIRIGHGADYDLTKVAVTLLLGVLGMIFIIPGFRAQADICKNEHSKSRMRFLMTLCAASWIVIHITVAVGIYVYAWCMHQGNAALAHDLTLDVLRLFRPVQLVAYGFLAVSLIMQITDIVREQTICPRAAVWCTPAVWMAALSAFQYIFPDSAFAYGLYVFCMNGGMIAWFIHLLCNCSVVAHNNPAQKSDEGKWSWPTS